MSNVVDYFRVTRSRRDGIARPGFFVFAAAVTIGAVLFSLAAFPEAFFEEHPLGSVLSPDGTQLAEYSWSPSGPVDYFVGISPNCYLTIRDAHSGVRISRYDALGDGPDIGDARSALDHNLPWREEHR